MNQTNINVLRPTSVLAFDLNLLAARYSLLATLPQ